MIGGFSTDPSRDPTDPWQQSLRDRMFVERVVFVSDFLDDRTATETAMLLMTLDANGDEPVNLHVDCSGGTLEAAFVLVDVIDLLGVDVHVVCAGQVAGPAIGVVAVARKRRATTHTRFRLTEPRLEISGRPREIEASMEHHRAQLKRFYERIAQAARRPLDTVEADMRAGLYMNAEEAVSYGLIDEVVRPDAKVLDFPRRLGFRPN